MRILIVDDSASVRDLMARFLRDVGQADQAGDGRAAVGMFKAALDAGQGYDLIIMDILMPIMDGHQALAEMRRLEQERGVEYLHEARVIMVTAVDDEESMLTSAFQGRSSAYLVKPVRKGRLLTKLREMEIVTGDEA